MSYYQPLDTLEALPMFTTLVVDPHARIGVARSLHDGSAG
jgi:hypothetical protein